MKKLLLAFLFSLLFLNLSTADELNQKIDLAKKTCKELGFKEGSEKLADCALELVSMDNLVGETQTNIVSSNTTSEGQQYTFTGEATFGTPKTKATKNLRDAVEILKQKKVNFKFDGEMQPDVALDEKYKELYPFSEMVGNANVLIMPGRHSAAISFKLMKSLSAVKVVGPLLIGLGQPIEIAPLRSSTSDILNLASVAAYSSDIIDYKNNKKN